MDETTEQNVATKEENTQEDAFFKFYEDAFKETRPMYENIIEAIIKSGALNGKEFELAGTGEKVAIHDGILTISKDEASSDIEDPKEITDIIVAKCKELDDQEVADTNGKVKESRIGLQGFFTHLGYEKNKNGFTEDTLKAEFMEIGSKALANIQERASEIDNLDLNNKENRETKRSYHEAEAFLGELAAGPFFPRTTNISASHFMSLGRIMQIGCSQGKTSVVAMTTYEQLKMGLKVFSTSSAPGLVPENYDGARDFYDLMGVSDQFCAISQNDNDKTDHIVLFYKGDNEKSTKYEIRADGKVFADGKEVELSRKELEHMGMVFPEGDNVVTYDFKASIKHMIDSKRIIMADTITLGKYQDLLPERDKNGYIPNSCLIVDEADAELLDTHPQELFEVDENGKDKVYEGEVAEKRRELRVSAREALKDFNDDPSKLEELAEKTGIPLDFLADAYEVKMKYSYPDKDTVNPDKYTVKDGRIFVLNPSTNVMIPASQGVAQAIIASDSNIEKIPEKIVIGETDIPRLFSNFSNISLMSGTMQDKGLSDLDDESKKAYITARKYFLQRCGNGLKLALEEGVIDWKLVTPQTRSERGNAIATLNGISREGKSAESTIHTVEVENIEVSNWRQYLEENKDALEENWKRAVQEEAEIRSNSGQPVMVSVYGDRNPMDGKCETYTDKKQIGDDHKYGDDKCLFSKITVDKNGKETSRVGEIACFDDFYGRGYTFKFVDYLVDSKTNKGEIVTKPNEKGKLKPVKFSEGGHVLITSLPQNSRNLEQFLFRVARGGDKGSSSIIISPNDPAIVSYLEKLEKSDAEHGLEKANAYLKGILEGSISVDKLVTDIYPEQSVELFVSKANLVDVGLAYESTLSYDREALSSVNKKLGIDSSIEEEYSRIYTEEMLKQKKLDRLTGVSPVDNHNTDKVTLAATKRIVGKLLKKTKEVAIPQLAALLPPGISKETIEEIVPKEILEEYLEFVGKIDKYNEQENAKVIAQAATRNTADQTLEAAKGDNDFNSKSLEEVVAEIRRSAQRNMMIGKEQVENKEAEGRE